MTPQPLTRRTFLVRLSVGALGLAAASCKRTQELFVDRAGGIRCGLPEWKTRNVEDDAAAGFLERIHPQGAALGRVGLSWEVDPRAGLPRDELLLRFSAVGPGARVLSPAAQRVEGHLPHGALELHGHPVAQVGTDDLSSSALRVAVWRCDKTGRLVRLFREGTLAPPLDELVAEVHCHGLRDRLVNGEVPTAAISSLGPGWSLARRSNASAGWLKDDAVLTLFAGQLTLPPDDLVEAAHLAPAWIAAAGLTAADPKSGERAPGPQSHPAIRLRGVAKLDDKDVRWTFVQWRCVVKKRTYGAIVFAQPPTKPVVGDDWTGKDAAVLSARCHGA